MSTKPDIHPSDCQSCSENSEPCRTHAEDWRYWHAAHADATTRVQELEADALSLNLPRHTLTVLPDLVLSEEEAVDFEGKIKQADREHDPSIPRHFRLAMIHAQRAFEHDDIGASATINEDLQGLVDAAVSWGRKQGQKGKCSTCGGGISHWSSCQCLPQPKKTLP